MQQDKKEGVIGNQNALEPRQVSNKNLCDYLVENGAELTREFRIACEKGQIEPSIVLLDFYDLQDVLEEKYEFSEDQLGKFMRAIRRLHKYLKKQQKQEETDNMVANQLALEEKDKKIAQLEAAVVESEHTQQLGQLLLQTESNKLKAINDVIYHLRNGTNSECFVVFYGLWRSFSQIEEGGTGAILNLSPILQHNILLYCGLDCYVSLSRGIETRINAGCRHLYDLQHYVRQLLCQTPCTEIEHCYVGASLQWQSQSAFDKDEYLTILLKTSKKSSMYDLSQIKRLAVSNSRYMRGYMRLDDICGEDALCEYTMVLQQSRDAIIQFLSKMTGELGYSVHSAHIVTFSRWFRSLYIIKPTQDTIHKAQSLGVSVPTERPPSFGCFGITQFPTSLNLDLDEYESRIGFDSDLGVPDMFVRLDWAVKAWKRLAV